MNDSKADNYIEDPEYPDNHDGEVVEEPFEVTWKDCIERACTDDGDTSATRTAMHACIRFLKGMGLPLNSKDWDSRIPIDAKGYPPPGYVPEPLCSFLIDTLEKTMSTPRRDVGVVMGMGKPRQPPKNKEELTEFLNRLSSAVGGEYPVEDKKLKEIFKSIAKRMNLDKDTVPRYWKKLEPIVIEFGFPPPKYEQNADIYEDLATIINHYHSLTNTPVRNGNTTRPPVYSFILKKIASQTGKDFSVVEQYLNIFLSEAGDPDGDLLEDLVTFINHYNSLMNSPHFEDGVELSQRREDAQNQIAVYMDKNLPSIERYWKVFDRTAENIMAPPERDEDEDVVDMD